jgi:hypothetical protein
MAQTNQTPAGGPGLGNSISSNSHTNTLTPARPQAQIRVADPIILASQARMTAELLAESLEIAIGFAVAALTAVHEADDEAIIASFRGFDAAARTARRCAEELRSLLGEAQG